MELIINSKNFTLSEVNKQFIKQKASKFLEELDEGLFNVNLTVKKTEMKYACQILYKDIIIVCENVDFHSCVTEACKKFLNQNRKLRRKYISEKRKEHILLPQDDDSEDNVFTEDFDIVVDVPETINL